MFHHQGRDEVVTVEKRKRGADNYVQFDRIMKCSKPAQPVQAKKLHGTPLFKEPGYFETIFKRIFKSSPKESVEIDSSNY